MLEYLYFTVFIPKVIIPYLIEFSHRNLHKALFLVIPEYLNLSSILFIINFHSYQKQMIKKLV